MSKELRNIIISAADNIHDATRWSQMDEADENGHTPLDRIVAMVESLYAPNPCSAIFDHKWLDPKCVQGGCRSRMPGVPDLNDPEVLWIMGRPNFVTGPFSHLLRAAGHTIRTKCEDEQAYTIHYWLMMYARHGKDWRDIVDQELEPVRQRLRDERTKKETPKTGTDLAWQAGVVADR